MLQNILLHCSDEVQDLRFSLPEIYLKQDLSSIDSALEKINAAWTAASEEMYKATQGQADPNAQANANASSGKTDDSSVGDDVTDVDFEEVKEDKK